MQNERRREAVIMTEREAGQLFERVDHLTTAVENLTIEMRKLHDAQTYGKGMLAGLLMVSGAVGAALVHAAEWLKALLK